MWPFSKKIISVDRDIFRPLHDEAVWKLTDAEKEIADLKASNERLADALAAAKERAGE